MSPVYVWKKRLLLTLLSKGRDNLDFPRNSTDEVPEEPHPPQNTPLPPSGADVGFADQCPTSTKNCVAKEGLSWHHIGYFQLYASSRHIRSTCKSCSDIQAKEISFWPYCMESFRKAAYRQFAFCRHGKLGKGNGRVMPSSVVLQIFFEYLITLAPTPRLCVTRKKNRSRDWSLVCEDFS